jgi:TonB family protein
MAAPAAVDSSVSKKFMRTRVVWALVAAAVVIAPFWDVRAAQLADVKAPRKIKDVRPVYPERSLAAGDEGVVVVELKVDASGAVTDAGVLSSRCPALNESALKATRGWQYEKVLVNGEPKPFTMTAQVAFRLPDKLKSRAGRPGACRWVDPPKPIF